MNQWYTSDTHFGHRAIVKFSKVRYKDVQTVEEMNLKLIENWNSRVKKGDQVFHLGDVAFGDWDVLEELNGEKYLVKGNHDRSKKALRELEKHFFIYGDLIILDKVNKLCMSHYPMYSWPMEEKGYTHLHGHLHGTRDIYNAKAIDVGVDCWELFPISIVQVNTEIKKRELNDYLQRKVQ